MPEPAGSETGGAAALVIAGVCALVAITCASRGALRLEPTPAAAGNRYDPEAEARAWRALSATTPAPRPAPAPVASAPGERDPEALELDHFYAALRGLERTHSGHVRVFWLGDSHTAADFMTGAVRDSLQQRFGIGGPGFVRIGATPYRHEQVRVHRDGNWRTAPNPPSRRSQQDDGIFGIAGMRCTALDGSASAGFEPMGGSVVGEASWELVYALPPGASFQVALGDVRSRVAEATVAETVDGSPLRHLRLSGSSSAGLSLSGAQGAPSFFGLFLEGSGAGVVLDTAGIDGARVATPLAWSETEFEAELRARAPELVVLAYGTNEVFDGERVERYADEYASLVSRLRRALPEADCLIVGPPDAGSSAGGSLPRVGEIDRVARGAARALGCGYVSLYALMGGEGSADRWLLASPPLARSDHIHYTVKGYELLGHTLAEQLLAAYARFAARP